MLTIDDCNSILKKYGECGFWYTLDLTKCSQTVGVTTYYDFMEVTYHGSGSYFIKMNNPFFHGLHYCTLNGQPHPTVLLKNPRDDNEYATPSTSGTFPDEIHLFFTTDDSIDLEYNFGMAAPMILPVNGLQIPMVNGEFDDKFYFTVARGGIQAYTIDDVEVEAETDEYGTFLRLPSAEDCIIGVKSRSTSYPLYKVTFREFKALPRLNIPLLYIRTPQKIKLINMDTEEDITEFQAYFQGRLLKDNIVTIPSAGVADIVVDLKDPNYPSSTVKLKTNATVYSCHNQAEVETAISEGIKYIRINGDIIVEGVEFNDMTISIRKGTFKNCIFNNSQIRLDGLNIYDDGGNVFNNCNILSSSLMRKLRMSTAGSVFNNCNAHNIEFRNYELYFTGTITNCKFFHSLVISDGDVTLTDNEFNGGGDKDYFPKLLYLTGDYTVTGNTFTITGEWEELAFNMCIIKANNDFNPSSFISNNTFDLNITYEDEPTNTFYYCLVDDDKIRAVRL